MTDNFPVAQIAALCADSAIKAHTSSLADAIVTHL